MSKGKLLYLVTEDWYFWSHRLPIAREAKRNGYEVVVATRVDRHGDLILAEGFRLVPLQMRRRSTGFGSELAAIWELVRIYRRERPDIVHHVAMKPVVYGSIAAGIAGVSCVVNALAGLGYVFASNQFKARLLRPLISLSMRMLLHRAGTRLILQNSDDVDLFLKARLARKEAIRLIRGSGVDTTVFHPVTRPAGVPTVTLASRMLWDKGIGAFAAAAGKIRAAGIDARFVLVGDEDPENPNSIPRASLQELAGQNGVEWWGKREDMAGVFSETTIFCLPTTYGEGVPKVLIEAASCGLPIVATDVPGCREVVRHGGNGLLVQAGNEAELVGALRYLIERPDEGARMGRLGREIVTNEFGVDKVVAETIAIYEELLKA